MARILPDMINADFLATYNIDEMKDCSPKDLTIKVWDLYGTAPAEGETISAKGRYIAAVVICDDCDKSVELHREKLA